MSTIFVTGVAVTLAGIIVFIGSIFLLLALIMGARLAYFVTASVTLAILVILGVVWSINPLGPVGQLPAWVPQAAADTPSQINFGPMSAYPNGPWQTPNKNDAAQVALASAMQGVATAALQSGITSGKVKNFPTTSTAVVDGTKTRLLLQGNKQYGAVTYGSTSGKPTSAVALFYYNPGDPLGPPRKITLGLFVVFALHLFGMNRIERKAKVAGNGGNTHA
ncbi:MAG: hypothetical protein QOH48_746 [Actinomycetota bacterium]|jgi:hypothetical protein|nr:hypothetical protein [Actinomycetota bacterium]